MLNIRKLYLHFVYFKLSVYMMRAQHLESHVTAAMFKAEHWDPACPPENTEIMHVPLSTCIYSQCKNQWTPKRLERYLQAEFWSLCGGWHAGHTQSSLTIKHYNTRVFLPYMAAPSGHTFGFTQSYGRSYGAIVPVFIDSLVNTYYCSCLSTWPLSRFHAKPLLWQINDEFQNFEEKQTLWTSCFIY